jgi:hypothetical protein
MILFVKDGFVAVVVNCCKCLIYLMAWCWGVVEIFLLVVISIQFSSVDLLPSRRCLATTDLIHIKVVSKTHLLACFRE